MGRKAARGGGGKCIYDGALQRRVSLRLMQGCWRHPEKYDKSSLQQLSLLHFPFLLVVMALCWNLTKRHVSRQQVSGSCSFTFLPKSSSSRIYAFLWYHTFIFVPLAVFALLMNQIFFPLQGNSLLKYSTVAGRAVAALKGRPASFVL